MSCSAWKTYSLDSLFDIIGGGTPKTSVEEYWNGNIPWLSVKDFNSNSRLVHNTEKSITELGLEKSSTKMLQTNDLIISARGTVGEIAQLATPMAFNQSCYGLRSKVSDISNTFLYYNLKYNLNVIRNNTHGSVFDTITRATFENIETNIPTDKDEIDNISNILETLDDKIELNNQMNETLEEIAQTLFKRWFVDFEFPNEEGLPYKSSGGEMVPSELGEIPKGWKVLPLENITLNITDGTHSTVKDDQNGDYYLLSCKNIKNDQIIISDKDRRINKETFDKLLKRTKLEKEDILITTVGTIGEVARITTDYINFDFQRSVGIIKPDLDEVCSEYLYQVIKSRDFIYKAQLRSEGSVQKCLFLGAIKSIETIVPNKTIMSNFRTIVKSIYKQVNKNNKEILELIKTRDLLLPKLMSGVIRV